MWEGGACGSQGVFAARFPWGVEQGTTQPPKLKGPGGWVRLVRALSEVGKWEPVRGRDAKEVSKSLGGLGGGWPWG